MCCFMVFMVFLTAIIVDFYRNVVFSGNFCTDIWYRLCSLIFLCGLNAWHVVSSLFIFPQLLMLDIGTKTSGCGWRWEGNPVVRHLLR